MSKTQDMCDDAMREVSEVLDLNPSDTAKLGALAESAALQLISQYIDFLGDRGLGPVSALATLTQISIILQLKPAPTAPITDYLRAYADAQDEAKANGGILGEATIKRLADLSLAITLAIRRDGAGTGYIT